MILQRPVAAGPDEPSSREARHGGAHGRMSSKAVAIGEQRAGESPIRMVGQQIQSLAFSGLGLFAVGHDLLDHREAGLLVVHEQLEGALDVSTASIRRAPCLHVAQASC
jgi:hypothetical protein